MYKKMFKYSLLVIAIIILSLSCSKDENSPSEPEVKYGSLEGNVTISNTDTPLEGVNISLDDEKFTNSDSEGKYKIDNIEIGEHNLKVKRSGFLEFIQTITLKEGANNKNIELTRESASFIDGNVTNALNEPIENVSVTIDENLTTTNNQGYFYMEGVKPGNKTIKFEAQFYVGLEQNISIPLTGSKTQNAKLVSSSLPQVKNLEYSIKNNSIELTWKDIDYPTLKGYNIYKSFADPFSPNDDHCIFLHSEYSKLNNNVSMTTKYEDFDMHKYNYWARYYILPVNIDDHETNIDDNLTIIVEANRPNNNKWIHSNYTTFPIEPIGPISIPSEGSIIIFRYVWKYTGLADGGSNDIVLNYDANWTIQFSMDNQNWKNLIANIVYIGNPYYNGSQGDFADLTEYRGTDIYYRVIGDLPEYDSYQDYNEFWFNIIVWDNE